MIVAAKYPEAAAAPNATQTGTPLSTRPLCAYPRIAHWSGKGSPDEAKNYICRAAASGG